MPLKTLLIVLASSVVCFLGFSAATLLYLERVVTKSETNRLVAIADAHSSEISILLESYLESSKILSSRTRLRDLLSEDSNNPDPDKRAQMTRILNDAVNGAANVISTSIFNTNAELAATAHKIDLGRDSIFDRRDYDALLETESEQSIETFLHEGRNYVLTKSILRLHGNIIGTSQTVFSSKLFAYEFNDTRFSETGEVILGIWESDNRIRILTGSTGNALTKSDEIVVEGVATLPMHHALAGKSIIMTEHARDYGGVPVLAVTRYIPQLDWGIVVKIDREEVTAKLTESGTILLMLGGALITINVLAILIVFRRRLSKEVAAKAAAESQFRRMFALAPNAMLIIDSDGVIEIANKQAEEFLAYPFGALTGANVDDLVPHQNRAGHKGLRTSFFAAPSARTMGNSRDVLALGADGREHPVEISLMPIETASGPKVITSLVDISARKEVQWKLINDLEARADALERSNKELDEFAYIAAHDLRAPLRGIEQLAAFIEEDAGDVMPERSRSDLQTLRNRIERMENLLNSLLDYSRIGRRDGEPVDVDMDDLLCELSELYIPADKFTFQMDANLPPVFAPRPAIELVFRNLLMNAVKHHDKEKGTIAVKASESETHLQFSITDDGPGIPEEYHGKIFKLFQTLKRRDEVEGSGMGLALVKKTLQVHNGLIEVLAAEGRGTTFIVHWPHRTEELSEAA